MTMTGATRIEVDKGPLVKVQYMQKALGMWRGINPWADAIPFESFPQSRKDAIEIAAILMMEVGHN